MNKFLRTAALFLALILSSNPASAQPLTIDQALDAVCRVNTSEARGSGTVFAEDEDKFYVMTNGHVIGRARRGHLEFFQDGYKSAMIPFKTEYSTYREGTALDLAILSVKKQFFGRYPPRVIPLAPKGTKIGVNDLVMAGGCPSAQWAMAWKGRVLRNAGPVISFNAAPIGGQSGSGVLILIKDGKGELHTRLGILLAWRVGDGAWTDDGEEDYGAGLSLQQIYEIMEGNGRDYPIETGYSVVKDEKQEAKNTKSAKERLNRTCPDCGYKIKDHVVIPHRGGLRKNVEGRFMYCPELKFSDGSIGDTARYYGGIKVGELYEGNGLFPWCPWDKCPPPNPNPNPNPPGGPDDGFNGWPGRPDPPDNPNPPKDSFDKERKEYLDKIAGLQDKLTNLEKLSGTLNDKIGGLTSELDDKSGKLQSLSGRLELLISNLSEKENELGMKDGMLANLRSEMQGLNDSVRNSTNEISGLKDLLGSVEGQKDSLKSKIDGLLGTISGLEANSGHYMDGVTGGNGNTVENVSLTLGGVSLGMLALKYGVPLLLNRRRRKKKKEDDETDDRGYDIDREPPPNEGSDDCVHTHIHEHNYSGPHCPPQPHTRPDHPQEYVMDRRDLPRGRSIDEMPNDFLPYGFKTDTVSSPGLAPQFPHVPFGSRKSIGPEQIMTTLGELVNEYGDDHTMTAFQIDTLLRQRLKKKYNIE
jgi:hypothetical protein